MRVPVTLVLLPLAFPLAGQAFPVPDSLVAGQDTSGAIAAFERLIQRDWRNAEARWRVGTLYMTRHPPGASNSPNRRRAEEHFRNATRFEPDSAKYWLALASLFRGEDWVLTRMQVEGLVERARTAAEVAGDTAALADAEYQAGRVAFERWEHYGHRWEVLGPTQRIQDITLQSDWNIVQQFFGGQARPIPESGDGPARNAESHLRRAVHLRPAHMDAIGRLVVVLGAQDRWGEALEVIRQVRRAVPDSGVAWALTGLAQARLNRWGEAETSFTNGLARMTPEQRAPYEDLTGILRTGDRAGWNQMTPAQRRERTALYWTLGQPLMLTERNELRTEYYARLTLARARWSDPERGLDGARTERGAVYVRFGPPDIEATFGREFLTWIYTPSRLRFTFRMAPGFANARLEEYSREAFEQVERQAPGRFDNVPVVRGLDTITVQVAAFRGANGRTDVALFGWVPLDRLIGAADLQTLTLESAAILRNDGGEVQRIRREETLDPRSAAAAQHRTWRLTLPAGDFYLRVEALVPALDVAARHSQILPVRSFNAPVFQVSDLLLARRLAPQDSAPARWTDFFIEPSAGRVEPGEAVSLLWEQYNLTPDADGTARWHVELRVSVTAVERRDFLARIVGGVGDAVGTSAVGSDRVTLTWDRSGRVAPGGEVVEYVTLEFGDAPAGSYEVTVAVTDQASGRTVERTRTLVRSALEPARR